MLFVVGGFSLSEFDGDIGVDAEKNGLRQPLFSLVLVIRSQKNRARVEPLAIQAVEVALAEKNEWHGPHLHCELERSHRGGVANIGCANHVHDLRGRHPVAQPVMDPPGPLTGPAGELTGGVSRPLLLDHRIARLK